jgi:SAM-dependent methyltransferase
MKRQPKYLLGDSRRESARLRAQARLWDPVSHALFDRLGVSRGWKILEIGPGQGSLHRELRRRAKGPIDAVERSPVFARRLRTLSAGDGYPPGRLWCSELSVVDLTPSYYDLIFARWVFLFLPDPAAHLKQLVRALKPGGRIALQEYHRETFAIVPLPDRWQTFLAAERHVYGAAGGDVTIGGRLPHLFDDVGLDVVEVVPTVMTGGPDTAVWAWVSDYYVPILSRYTQYKPFNQAAAARLRRQWLSAARQPSSMMIAPAVLDVVGRRP